MGQPTKTKEGLEHISTAVRRVVERAGAQLELKREGEHSAAPLVGRGIAVSSCSLDGNEAFDLALENAELLSDFDRIKTAAE